MTATDHPTVTVPSFSLEGLPLLTDKVVVLSGVGPGLGRSLGETRDYSEQTAHHIDAEVGRIISDCYARAKSILVEHGNKMARLAETLLEQETVDRDEFLMLMRDDMGEYVVA